MLEWIAPSISSLVEIGHDRKMDANDEKHQINSILQHYAGVSSGVKGQMTQFHVRYLERENHDDLV
jgi:hypothetical protein